MALHVDEAQYWAWSQELAWGYYSKPPLIAALMAGSTALFGHDELGVKAWSSLLTAATALVLGGWVAAMSADARRGALAALLALASPLLLLLSWAATTDVPLLLMWSLAAWALWSALQQPTSAIRWGLLGAAVGAGVLSKYTMLAFIPGALLAAVALRPAAMRWLPMLRGGLLASVVACVIVAPHLAWNAQAGWPTWRHTADITLQRNDDAAARGALAFALGQAVLLGPLALAWLAWSRRQADGAGQAHNATASPATVTAAQADRLQAARRFAVLLSAPLLLLGLAQAARGGANINWAAPALLGGWAWLALRLPLQPRQAAAWLAPQALAVVALLLAPGIASALGQPWPRSLDFWARMRGWDVLWAELAAPLPNTPAQVVGASRTVLAHGRYHWRTRPVQWYAWDPQRQARYHDAWRHGLDVAGLQTLLRQNQPVWLIADDPVAGSQVARLAAVQADPLASAHWTDPLSGQTRALWAWQLHPLPPKAP
ncbi:Undecaprenyl phosphate-alpha-4-amino-4-deoxy-L-arabinose arabinosyl transferase [Tepidimonas alkaliphilus]|uniref:Undecaprenyl phosphate-alpha-4-amino-4-deoxy-L-arabinose arabinosyl transferase n=1 Tax=Tepidimonas alkaliphilus TaxID=2588942 RepID=A0A554W6U2_9BURK|nr:glycosyltransferase family 39 protein [Tepidimonas alkaliphilus]TSE19289.1 Undecaprenyl phosphate-alpha-4-amino-4-deoxy-L-arabinose arabinosyl transferase [Tepidimonas alkaliphilus]